MSKEFYITGVAAMRKMDEMEMKINLDSIRIAWVFTVVSLLAWGIYDFVRTGGFALPFYLLILQNIVYFFATNISKWRMGDKTGAKTIVWYFILVVICLVLFGIFLYLSGR